MPVILVIDDDPRMADLIQDMVAMAGYETAVAYSGLEGLDHAREGMPDLILVDIRMPEMDGWQVYQKLREFSSIPVMFVTAQDTPENAARAEALGAEGFLSKDHVTPLQLAQQIQFVLESREAPGRQSEYLH